jgi:HPt (histidine-containing phosphotransfer) domain-containing protein
VLARVRYPDEAMDLTQRSARLQRLVELQHQFLESALADTREILAVLEERGGALAAADDVRLRKLAHDLRGTGAVYGFSALSETAARLESAFFDAEPSHTLRRCVDELLSAVTEARDELKILPKGIA